MIFTMAALNALIDPVHFSPETVFQEWLIRCPAQKQRYPCLGRYIDAGGTGQAIAAAAAKYPLLAFWSR
jgi:hypothetical protein